MEDLNFNELSKYQVTIHFEMDNDFMSFVPPHRIYINSLIEKGVIDYYSVSMETQRCWIIINAASKKEVTDCLQQSPLKNTGPSKWMNYLCMMHRITACLQYS
jgi:hypothetical protein